VTTEPNRREILHAIGGSVGAGALFGRASVGTAGARTTESWPQFGYDVANSGHALGNTGPEGPIGERWGFDAGRVFGSPAVVHGIVYVASRFGTVYALNAVDGTELWSVEVGTDGHPELHLYGSPAVGDETVYVAEAIPGRDVGSVYALDAATGDELWQFVDVGEVSSPPTVADGTVYVGSDDWNVYALDAEDGSEHWRFETGGWVQTAPAVVGDTVYVGGWDVYALDATDGTERWRARPGAPDYTAPAVVDDGVYVGCDDGNVYALDAADGSERWRFETIDEVSTSPAVADGTVYVGSHDFGVYAIDAGTGDERWRVSTGGKVYSSPSVVDETVYVGSHDGNVYGLDASDGTERWRFPIGDEVYSSPAVADGSVYVGAYDDSAPSVYALGRGSDAGNEGRIESVLDRFDGPETAVGLGALAVGGGYAAYRRFSRGEGDGDPSGE